jgi:hypothetical protein
MQLHAKIIFIGHIYRIYLLINLLRTCVITAHLLCCQYALIPYNAAVLLGSLDQKAILSRSHLPIPQPWPWSNHTPLCTA